MAYWQDYPPTHVLVAAYLMGGNKARSNKGRHRSKNGTTSGHPNSNFDELAREVTVAGGTVHKKLPEVYRQRQN